MLDASQRWREQRLVCIGRGHISKKNFTLTHYCIIGVLREYFLPFRHLFFYRRVCPLVRDMAYLIKQCPKHKKFTVKTKFIFLTKNDEDRVFNIACNLGIPGIQEMFWNPGTKIFAAKGTNILFISWTIFIANLVSLIAHIYSISSIFLARKWELN
jgi:hypothetical protein